MRFWHLNLTLGASLIASSASIIPRYPPLSISSRRHSSPVEPRVTALISTADSRRGLVRTLSRHSRPTPFRTLPRTIVTRLASGLSSALGVPRTRLCRRFRVLANLTACNRATWLAAIGSRLDAITPAVADAHLSLASRSVYQKWPTMNTHSSRPFN